MHLAPNSAPDRVSTCVFNTVQRRNSDVPTLRKSHLITIRLRVDKPITAKQARFAAWNALHRLDLYGAETVEEPWAKGKVLVPLRPSRKPDQTKTNSAGRRASSRARS
jgi:hypothetical protein